MCNQLRKARATWARVRLLRTEKVSPHVVVKFYGGGTGRAAIALRQRDVGPFEDRLGKTRGVPHPRTLTDGKEAYAVEGARARVDLPEVEGCVERVWDAHTGGVHQHGLPAGDHGVRGDLPNSHRMQAGRAKEGSSSAPLVVGATNGPGRQMMQLDQNQTSNGHGPEYLSHWWCGSGESEGTLGLPTSGRLLRPPYGSFATIPAFCYSIFFWRVTLVGAWPRHTCVP
jgi:hypothetical protein